MERMFRTGRWLLLKVLTPFTFALAILFAIIVVKDPCSLKVTAADWLQVDYHGNCSAGLASQTP
jgi:hypothetical protein